MLDEFNFYCVVHNTLNFTVHNVKLNLTPFSFLNFVFHSNARRHIRII